MSRNYVLPMSWHVAWLGLACRRSFRGPEDHLFVEKVYQSLANGLNKHVASLDKRSCSKRIRLVQCSARISFEMLGVRNDIWGDRCYGELQLNLDCD